jgi:hypothetical protein
VFGVVLPALRFKASRSGKQDIIITKDQISGPDPMYMVRSTIPLENIDSANPLKRKFVQKLLAGSYIVDQKKGDRIFISNLSFNRSQRKGIVDALVTKGDDR